MSIGLVVGGKQGQTLLHTDSLLVGVVDWFKHL